MPGNNPNRSPGAPVAGQPAYVRAHVVNRSAQPVNGVRIDFWWADPSGQVLRSMAHPIGSALRERNR